MVGVWIGGALAALILAVAAALPPALATPALQPTPHPQTAPATGSKATPAATASPNVSALLERHRQALGALPYSAASWSGVISQNGEDTAYSTVADSSGRFRTTYAVAFGQRLEGSDGTVAWTQDVNGSVITTPLQRRSSLAVRLLHLNTGLLNPDSAWTFDGIAQVDGKRVYRLRTSYGTISAVYYLDVDSALLDGVDFSDSYGPYREVRYPEYRRVGQLVLPTKVVETEKNTSAVTTIGNVQFSAPAATDFSAPTQRWADFPSGQSTVTLDFDSPRSLIVIGGQINGTSEKFLLDSGSSTSLIDLDEARRIGMPTAGSARVVGAVLLAGSAARADTLDLNGLRFTPFVFQAVPLGLPSSIQGFKIKGILGFDVLSRLVTRIDYPRGRVQFASPATFAYAGTGQVITLDPSARVPRVPATLGESDPANFTIDTGSDAGLILYQDFAQDHARDFMRPGDLAADAPSVRPADQFSPEGQPLEAQPLPMDVSQYFGDRTQANGAGGSIHVKTSIVSRVGLGKFTVSHVFTEIVMQPTGAFSPSLSDGLLGAAILSKFGAVFLDYPGKRLILER